MNVPQSKIHKVVSSDKSKFPLTEVYLDKEKNRLVAADGFIMAVVPVNEIGDAEAGGLIDPGAIELAQEHGAGQLVIDDDCISVLGTGWHVDRPQGQYPDYEQILRNRTDSDKAAPVMVLDAGRLHRLAQAICHGTPWLGVRLFLPQKPGDAIQVRPKVENGARGALMPMSHKDNEDVDLTPLAHALENDEEITAGMRAVLKQLLGID